MLPYLQRIRQCVGCHTSRSARKALEQARRQIAAVLDITPGEVFHLRRHRKRQLGSEGRGFRAEG